MARKSNESEGNVTWLFKPETTSKVNEKVEKKASREVADEDIKKLVKDEGYSVILGNPPINQTWLPGEDPKYYEARVKEALYARAFPTFGVSSKEALFKKCTDIVFVWYEGVEYSWWTMLVKEKKKQAKQDSVPELKDAA